MVDKLENTQVNEEEISGFLPFILKKLENLDREDIIKRFVSTEFNRFLEYYRNAPDLNVDESVERAKRNERDRVGGSTGFVKFKLNIGGMEGIAPPQLIGLINDLTGVRTTKIGRIQIRPTFCLFEVDNQSQELVMKSFANQQYQGRKLRLDISTDEDRPSSFRRSGGGGYGGSDRGGYRGDRGGDRNDRGDRGGDYGDRPKRPRKRDY